MWPHSSPWNGVTWVPCFYPSGCSESLSFLCEVCVVHTYMWVYRFIPVCRHVETRAGCGVSSSIICLFTLRQILSELEAILAWLAGWQTPEICLSPLTLHGPVKPCPALHMGPADSNSGPHVCRARTLNHWVISPALLLFFIHTRILLLILKQKTQLAFGWNLLRLQTIGW